MNKTTKTWAQVLLVLAILLLILYLLKKKAGLTPLEGSPKPTQTNTGVTIQGIDSTQFPTRDQNNNRLLRVCTYDNGEQLSLDPGQVGGQCPVVYTDIAGNSGHLVKDEIIVLPNAGNYTGSPVSA